MRAVRLAVPLVVTFGLMGCGAAKDVTMPEVTGKKLDAAYDKIKSAGFDDKDKIKIEGGGTFGVVMEGNWTICEQSPAAGKTVSGALTLTVERSCDDYGDQGTDEPTETPSETSIDDPTPSPTASATPTLPAILTVKNNPEFAALLKLGDNCSNKVDRFAKKYAGKTVQFDGSVGAMAPHGNTKTHFDMLAGAATSTPTRRVGLASSSSTRTRST
jgi:hypothetical protein